MKRLITLLITLLMVSILITSPIKAGSSSGIRLATALCELAAVDKRSKMRKKIKRARLSLRTLYKDTTCNGKFLYTWAKEHNATEVMKFIKTKMGKRINDELEE